MKTLYLSDEMKKTIWNKPFLSAFFLPHVRAQSSSSVCIEGGSLCNPIDWSSLPSWLWWSLWLWLWRRRSWSLFLCFS